MEITAVLEAVRALDGPLEVVSDSMSIINCFRDRWWEGWLQTNWCNRQRKLVANRDLWEPLIEILRHRDIRFRWVQGHSATPMNDLVVQLAVRACQTQQGQQGNVSDAGDPSFPPYAPRG
jgi:ribonuclease HI